MAKKEEKERRQRIDYLVKDISDRRNNMASLRQEEEFYRQAVAAFSNPVMSDMFKNIEK